MSISSSRPPARVRLVVTADPGTEISLIDHNLQVCGRGIGALDAEMVPGLYKLRYQAGLTVQQDYQAIEPGDGVVEVSAPQVLYSSAAPLFGTRDNDPYHQAASEFSRKVHATVGKGSQVFVFARSGGGPAGLSRVTGGNPAAGLSLHNRDGARLVDLGKVARRTGATDRWAGCTVELQPGEYRLRLAAPEQHRLEQVIVTSPGWQTQVFLTHSSGEPAGGGQPGGLVPARTSVLQARVDRGFDAQSGAARLADLARIGLTNRRAIVPLPELPGMLSGASADPMLGIYAAHALLSAGGFDKAQLAEVVTILRSLLGQHPDVEAVAHELGVPDPGYVFDCPPMLTSSWPLILAASARQTGLIPPGSLTERVSSHLWGGGPWLMWLSDELAKTSPQPAEVDLPDMVAQVTATALLGYPSRRAALGNAKLTDIEEALLTRVSRPFEAPASGGQLEPYGPRARPERSLDPDVSQDPAQRLSRDLVEALDLPPAAIPQVAASLLRKLEHAARAGARFRRLWSQLRGPFIRWYLRFRRRGTGRKPAWRGTLQFQIRPIATGAVVVIWLTSMIGLAATLFRGSPPGFEIAIDGILSAVLALSLSLTLGSAVFLWRRSRVHLPYLRRARDEPHRMAGTAGSVTGDVIGRDELCQVIIDDLRDRDTRRPHVVVGGVGTGKTALLVRLTRLLAEQGALPVLVRLHDAQDSLDFRDLAYQRFIADDDAARLSEADGETVWRQLYRNDKIVVLADGLEEALTGVEPGAKDRENLIRLALRQAREHRLPLVVASRPHGSLTETQAAIVELEPLSEEAALQWLHNGNPGEAKYRPDLLVTGADVADKPLYLRIAHQLQDAGLMPGVTQSLEHHRAREQGADRMGFRFVLLETWMEALLAGHLAPEVPLSPADRNAAVGQLSVLACLGLGGGTRQVIFDDFEALRNRKPPPAFITDVADTLARTGHRFDVGLAAIWGTELGLVAAHPNGVRFPDSLIEAHLGSRLIETAMADEEYRSAALTAPGRELLIALVMSSRAKTSQPAPLEARPEQLAARSSELPVTDLLRQTAPTATSVTALYLYAAALQIDCADQYPAHCEIANEIEDRWAGLAAEDQRSLDQAKLNLVRHFGEAVRMVAENQRAGLGIAAQPAYRQLYRIAVTEPSHSVRMECAQQISACGDAAFDALQGLLGPLDGTALPDRGPQSRPRQPGRKDAEPYDRAWRENVLRAWLASLLAGSATRNAPAAQKNLTEWLRFVSRRDDPEMEVRQPDVEPVTRPGQRICHIGDERWRRLAVAKGLEVIEDDLACAAPKPEASQHRQLANSRIAIGWAQRDLRGEMPGKECLHPGLQQDKPEPHPVRALFTGPMVLERLRDARHQSCILQLVSDPQVERLICHVSACHQQVRAGLRLSLEVALAQGFKFAANRRSPQLADRLALANPEPLANQQAYAFLLEQAREMLRGTHFWFARLTLVQALCLLSLGSSPARRSAGSRDADHAALIAHWAGVPDGQPEHPFVAEARKLAARVLETGEPERFMWIDETSVAARIGSRPADPRGPRWHNLWIPPSAGWVMLHPHAQKLLAEVLLLLNLAECGARPRDSVRQLKRTDLPYLPPCLEQDRSPLDPTRTIGRADASHPGTNCRAGCPFRLCPYPPQGEKNLVELSEAFCRRQQELVSWREPNATDLKRFWRQMAQRARP